MEKIYQASSKEELIFTKKNLLRVLCTSDGV